MNTTWHFIKAMFVVVGVPLLFITIYLIAIFLPWYLMCRFMGD